MNVQAFSDPARARHLPPFLECHMCVTEVHAPTLAVRRLEHVLGAPRAVAIRVDDFVTLYLILSLNSRLRLNLLCAVIFLHGPFFCACYDEPFRLRIRERHDSLFVGVILPICALSYVLS